MDSSEMISISEDGGNFHLSEDLRSIDDDFPLSKDIKGSNDDDDEYLPPSGYFKDTEQDDDYFPLSKDFQGTNDDFPPSC